MRKNTLRYTLLCIAILLIGCSNSTKNGKEETPTTVVGTHGKLSVNGTFLVNEKGEKIQLRGVSYGWHNWWPRFYNSSTVEIFANDWNCNLLRAAIGVEEDGCYIDNPEEAVRCATVIADAAIAQGIYVIIDWHSHGIRTGEAKQFFTQMANRYKDQPNVIYEIFNEPVDDSWEDVKAYSIEIIRTIRAIDPDNIILVGTPHWDQDIHLAADDPITGFSNMMYTLHFYAASHQQALRDRADYAIQKGLPIFVSECAGMEATGDGPINHTEWAEWVSWMKRNTISWAAWSIADKDETCSMMKKTASSTGPWTEAELKEWAITCRNNLMR